MAFYNTILFLCLLVYTLAADQKEESVGSVESKEKQHKDLEPENSYNYGYPYKGHYAAPYGLSYGYDYGYYPHHGYYPGGYYSSKGGYYPWKGGYYPWKGGYYHRYPPYHYGYKAIHVLPFRYY